MKQEKFTVGARLSDGSIGKWQVETSDHQSAADEVLLSLEIKPIVILTCINGDKA
jgi:hypothetical protein